MIIDSRTEIYKRRYDYLREMEKQIREKTDVRQGYFEYHPIVFFLIEEYNLNHQGSILNVVKIAA